MTLRLRTFVLLMVTWAIGTTTTQLWLLKISSAKITLDGFISDSRHSVWR